MRLSLLNGFTLGVLLVLALASGAMSLMHSRLSEIWDLRMSLAQDSYAEHLALQSNINALFKQHGDALLFGDRDNGALEDQIKELIAGNIARIREVIAMEINLVGGEEIEELGALSGIEGQVQSLTETLQVLSADGSLLSPEVRRAQMIHLMDQEVDNKLSARITEALTGERDEVSETLAEGAAFRTVVERIVLVLSALSVVATVAAVILYQRGVAIPARQIMAVVSRYEAGDFSDAPEARGAAEMQHIAAVLGRMAALLRGREATQAEQKRALEDAVLARTSELSRVLAQIEQGERARRRMLADVSHELRTPLTVIQGEAEVTLRSAQVHIDDYRETLVRVRETAKHANAIVDDLLLIARQEASELRLDLIDVDLAKLAARTVGLVHHAIKLDLHPNVAVVRADPVRVRQCLLALMQNAIRYGGTQVAVTLSPTAAGFRLAVEDNGPGMSDPEKAEAFERFFRGSNTNLPGVDGTGLGLPIVRSIIKAHGGSVGIDDREGGGLRVWIDLPAVRSLKLVRNEVA